MLPYLILFMTLSLAGCASRLNHATASKPGHETTLSPHPAKETLTATDSTSQPGPEKGIGSPNGQTEVFEEFESRSEEAEDVTFLTDLKQTDKVQVPCTEIPIESNDKVDFFLKQFKGPQKRWIHRAMNRSGRYLPQMQEIFREEGLPEELVYLALIESGYNPYAYSRAGAMGIWQFMAPTGRRYGLVINWWVDERRDLEKSTRAAARYLKDLYALFDDWYLAAAAYNAGEGKIKRAIRKYESNNFWHLSKKRYLKKETKNYVPRLLAVMTIARKPDLHGFGDLEPEAPLLYEVVALKDATDLAIIAEGCGFNLTHLKSLNPQLRRGCTPPFYRGAYEIKIPLGAREQFLAYYAELSPKKRLTFRRHKIKEGETLSHIARRYGVSIRSVTDMNNLKSRHRIREGKSLVVPVPAYYASKGGVGDGIQTSKRKTGRKNLPDHSKKGSRKIVHVVKKGDTLWTLRSDYHVKLSSLKAWNRLNRSSRIYPGQNLAIWKKRSSQKTTPTARTVANAQGARKHVHRVKKGDTLWTISRGHQVKLSSLKAWNGFTRSSRIYPGQNLVIWKDEVPPFKTAQKESIEYGSKIQESRGEIWHVVQPGDTLWEIARRYRVTLTQLSRWNKIDLRHPIHPGLRLRICRETGLEANADHLYADKRTD